MSTLGETISFQQPEISEPLVTHGELHKKVNGIHYTPPLLASYLAKQAVEALLSFGKRPEKIAVLDPACGEGELLTAIIDAVPKDLRRNLILTGFDKDEDALAKADKVLRIADTESFSLHCTDFLSAISSDCSDSQMSLGFPAQKNSQFNLEKKFDLVISNPPYVRTQVLGAELAKELAHRFNLTGRVDLYHAFVKAMTLALCEGGILGLLTSNRFLSVQSGVSTREWLLENFRLLRLVDLGDTKFFDAAVLPAILIAQRTSHQDQDCEFIRVYENSTVNRVGVPEFGSVLEALDGSFAGDARVRDTCYHVETGRLQLGADGQPWSMTNSGIETWLETLKQNSEGIFSDFGKVCVGIKTTADSIFIRDDWNTLPVDECPEEELLHPLVTHHIASRWRITSVATKTKRVLYPYESKEDSRVPVNLSRYPRAHAYLAKHRQRLEGRSYVTESGRQWYEIWVPHNPTDWGLPKLAFPDISETNNFFFAEKGWIINGDCYWIKLLPGKEMKWLWLMLAVANSTFILKFYDAVFHNKLYSGRRRFMSQYVSRFPLPKLESSQEILRVMPSLLDAVLRKDTVTVEKLQRTMDELVWTAFGLVKEVAR